MDNVPVLALHDAADPVEIIAGALASGQLHIQDSEHLYLYAINVFSLLDMWFFGFLYTFFN
jgi:hypothetical protein